MERKKVIGMTALLLLLVGFYLFLLFYRLGVHPIFQWDESIYGQVAREALQNHRYATLTWFGHNWFEKPPLMIWLTAGSFVLFGITELAARLPVALFAALTVLLSLWWAWQFRRKISDPFFTLLGFYFCFPFLTAAYFLQLDTPVAFFVLLTCYAAYQGIVRSPKWWYVAGATLGLGVMTKSIIGLLPIVAIGLWLIVGKIKRQFVIPWKDVLWGLALAFLIAAPWHIIMSMRFGGSFWNLYVGYHIFDRYTRTVEINHGWFWNYFYLLFFQSPASGVFFAIGIFYGGYRAMKDNSWLLVYAAWLSLFLVFTFSKTQLPTYIIPALPPLLLITGFSLTDLLGKLAWPRLRILIGVCLFVAAGLMVWFFNTYKYNAGEFEPMGLSGKPVGIFLQTLDPKTEVYMDPNEADTYVIGFYANRLISPASSELMEAMRSKPVQIFRAPARSVYDVHGVYVVAP